MNPYFNMNETIYDVTEKYPAAIAVFVSSGFENMQNKALRETLGKTITIEHALKLKKMNEEVFEERLVTAIEESDNGADTTLNQKQKKAEAANAISRPVKN